MLGGTEVVTLAPVLVVPGWPPVAVPSVDLGQHLAEKLHALCTMDAHSRPSTRVKDLVDVVLLIEAGVIDEPHAAQRLRAVFAVRDSRVPVALPTPPDDWANGYAAIVGRIGHDLPLYDEAVASAQTLLVHLTQSPSTSNPQESRP